MTAGVQCPGTAGAVPGTAGCSARIDQVQCPTWAHEGLSTKDHPFKDHPFKDHPKEGLSLEGPSLPWEG